MKKFNYIIFILQIMLFWNIIFSQQYHHSGNNLHLSFTSNGKIVNKEGFTLECPLGTGHEFLDFAYPIVALQTNETNLVSQFSNTNGIIAMNQHKESLPDSWNGIWEGYYGNDSLNADWESWYKLEDPSAGLTLIVRGWQWSHYLAQDMIFLHYKLINSGNKIYDNSAFGFVINPAVGGDDDDVFQLDLERSQINIIDEDNIGHGRGIAEKIGEWGPVGQLSVAFVETPNQDGTNTPLGLSSVAAFPSNGFDKSSPSDVWSALSMGKYDDLLGVDEIVLGTGNFTLNPGDTKDFTLVVFISQNDLDLERNESIVDIIVENQFTYPVAPPTPNVNLVAGNGSVTLYWDRSAEESPGFEGYKIYRSTDPGFNDVYTVTDDRAILIYRDPIITFDLDNDIKGLFDLHTYGFQYYLGNNSGIKHWWRDDDVINGKTYYYAVVAYNKGIADSLFYPTESTKSIVIDKNGNIITESNTVVVTPSMESIGYQSPEYFVEHNSGYSNGMVTIEIIDRTLLLEDREYQISFNDSTYDYTTYTIVRDVNSQNPDTLISDAENYSSEFDFNDADPNIDGMHFFLEDTDLVWDPEKMEWKPGTSNWIITLTENSNFGPALKVPVDYEVRFSNVVVDTGIFTSPIPVLFEIWNITDDENEYKENFLIVDQNGNGSWDSGELIYICEGSLQDFQTGGLAAINPIYWTITMTAPDDTTIESIPPESGDLLFIPTIKPFSSKDIYTVTTNSASIESIFDKSVLDDVAVVPNPYIIFSEFEQKSLYTGGTLQNCLGFTNLPQKCTIRIFNLRGYLVDTIEYVGDIDKGFECWNLHNKDNQMISYGIYIYHVDAPGIGQKIGRFAVIR